ncbi:unnamed protein product [Coffea canephora]|uniref:Hexosyltransferase n=1 Tax=Coffea canephora TaxID=49390 RepID=A0A068V393_COFCA|nr:unnamed protein product [Coffea canephora]
MAADMVSKTATKAAKRLAKAGSLPNRAYVTFLAGDGDYWKGAVGLVKGLRKAKSANPLVVALLPDVPQDHRNKLINQGRIAREIEPAASPPEGQDKFFAWAYYAINHSKLRMWEVKLTWIHHTLNFLVGILMLFLLFVEHSEMVYLDADVQVFNNRDNFRNLL